MHKVKEKKYYVAPISFRVIAGTFLFVICLALFSIIADEIVLEKEDWFDYKIFLFINQHSAQLNIQLFYFFTFFGSSVFLMPSYVLIVALLLFKHRKNDALNVAILALSSTLLLHVLKSIFGRPRPSSTVINQLETFSFPSGHALSSFVFFSVLVWEVWQSATKVWWKWTLSIFFFLFALTVGVSRVILHYHYASDVLAGLSLGLAYVLLYFWLQKKWEKRKS